MDNNFSKEHREFIIRSLGEWIPPTKVIELMFDEVVAVNECFELYNGTIGYLEEVIKKIDKKEILTTRAQWLNDVDSIPEANKKVRIRLIKLLYDNSTDEKFKLQCLKAIKEEKLAEKEIEAKKAGAVVNVAVDLKEEFKERIEEKENRIKGFIDEAN